MYSTGDPNSSDTKRTGINELFFFNSNGASNETVFPFTFAFFSFTFQRIVVLSFADRYLLFALVPPYLRTQSLGYKSNRDISAARCNKRGFA